MVRLRPKVPWEFNPHEQYVPLLFEGEVVGFCKPEYARRMLAILNEEEKHRKALQMACYDLVAKSGGNRNEIQDRIQQYLAKAARPTSGTGAIALLLKERQSELDLTDEEFCRFCDTFRLSRQELGQIYSGADMESNQLNPLARILGLSVDEVIYAWKGGETGGG